MPLIPAARETVGQFSRNRDCFSAMLAREKQRVRKHTKDPSPRSSQANNEIRTHLSDAGTRQMLRRHRERTSKSAGFPEEWKTLNLPNVEIEKSSDDQICSMFRVDSFCERVGNI